MPAVVHGMQYSLLNRIVFFLIIFVAFSCSVQEEESTEGFERIFRCGAETVNDSSYRFSEAEGQEQQFGNVETRTRDFARTGDFGLKLTPATPYGFTTELVAGPDEYIRVTAWRKSADNNGAIIIDGGEGFYSGGKYLVEKDENGWQKIFLEVYTPPNFSRGKVKIFVWNNSQDTVYFDDIEIMHRDKKQYPEYQTKDAIKMYVDDKDLARLQQKRMTAFETTVLVNSDEDYSNLVLFDGNQFLNAEYRLKGDLLDHLQGDKWSFRIKLKKTFAWKHLLTFSVQNPFTRNFVYEWLAHQIFDREDVLTTRYGFIPLTMNDRSLGIYAWEEHFEKQLVESRNRREGPIVRFDESIFWERVLETKKTGRAWDIDYFAAAPIIPFKEGQVVADSAKVLQMVEAQKLMLQYKNRRQPVSTMFDIDKLAKYFALIDLTQAYHGFTWHNQRFYYNPVTCLLEPIAFDGYIEGGIYKRFEEPVSGMVAPAHIAELSKEELMLFQPFADSLFTREYISCLEKYSSPDYIRAIVSDYREESDSLSAEIRKEFPYYRFDFGYLKTQATWIRENLDAIALNVQKLGQAVRNVDPAGFAHEYTSETNAGLIPMMVHAYFDRKNNSVEILSFHNNEVKILGAFLKDRLPESFDSAPDLQPFKGLEPGRVSVNVSGIPTKILFSVEGVNYETEVYQWKYSDTLSERQKIFTSQTPGLTIEENQVVFDGEYIFTSDVVIPPNLDKVVFNPGATIDLRAGAGFFCFVPVEMNGTEEKPVVITSGDHLANGFNVIQPGGRSRLQHAHFVGLNSLRKGGWMTPAAVAFYEADLDADNCVFEANHNCDDALNVVRSDFYVENCRFENTFADAFDSDFCTGKVVNCVFNKTGNDAIDFSGSRITISGCTMTDIADKAISGGEHSFLTVNDCTITRAHIGIASKDESQLDLKRIKVERADYGIMAFQKKPEYGSASIKINDLKMKMVVIFHQIEEGSVLTLNGKLFEGRERKLAQKLYQ